MEYWIKTLIVVLIAISGNISNIHAGEERYSNYIDVEPGQANDTIIVIDDRFGNQSEWSQIEQTAFVNNLLLFEVNEHGGKMISAPSTFTVNIEIGLWLADDDPMKEPSQIMLETLSFKYDPNATAVTPYQSFERYTNGHKMRIVIKSVLSSSGGVDTAPDLRISGEIHLNRYYHFDNDDYPLFNNLPHAAEVSDQFLVS
ncbi:MAG: hypothetical protein KJP00_10005, partial [Bacteroidia bacterium]|nr:hypothetical protein [Bacteroidia bacterium]